MVTKSFVSAGVLYTIVQAIARGVGSGVDDAVSLDVHAINELKDKGFNATDDAPKYCYTADSSGNYSELSVVTTLSFNPLCNY